MSFIQRSVHASHTLVNHYLIQTRNMIRLGRTPMRTAYVYTRTHLCTCHIRARMWNGKSGVIMRKDGERKRERERKRARVETRVEGSRAATFETLDVPLAPFTRVS